jgi:hypothetical protein
MHFKEWLLQNETAGDSWIDPTAQPIQWLLRAQINGAPLQGVMNLSDYPPGSIRDPYKADLLAKLTNYFKRHKKDKKDDIKFHHANESLKSSDTVHEKLVKWYMKMKPKMPRPQEFKDAPDQYTTAGWDAVGEPDTGQRANFKVLPSYT